MTIEQLDIVFGILVFFTSFGFFVKWIARKLDNPYVDMTETDLIYNLKMDEFKKAEDYYSSDLDYPTWSSLRK